MPDITDPVALKFVREQVRPLCEAARALKARIAAATTDWYAGTNNLFPNDTSLVDDGRAAEGVSQLTGADVNNAMTNLISAHDALNDQIIALPCVRPLDVTIPNG